jgi:prolyl-tRNA synthetase
MMFAIQFRQRIAAMSNDQKLTPQSQDFNEWYNSVVRRAELADYGPVRGTMIVKPYGWSLWENVQQALDRRFKAVDIENAAFPMLVPMSFLEKEASHVEGFSPELAVVTHGGGEELAEPLAVRPTSEAIIGHTYANWIQSYRDLPVLINLWNSVVRWEMRTKLFLRTSEFYWQEGHTAHATGKEALDRTIQMLEVYADFALNEAAIPVVTGEKSELERFAGADRTFTIEAMMRDGRALQSATSHFFGQKFARAFDITYSDENNTIQYCWTTSWGLSTRMIGAIIMTHGDDNGLLLPPRLAPVQVVIIPIFRNDSEKGMVLEVVEQVRRQLSDAEIRHKTDLRDGLSPGFKFHEWELKGVPVRIEIGPRDVSQHAVTMARRDMPGREGKTSVSQEDIVPRVKAILGEIQNTMLHSATGYRQDNTADIENYADFREAVRTGFARVWWAGTNDDETRIKEETQATIRCFPLDQPETNGVCFFTGKPSSTVAIFARSY